MSDDSAEALSAEEKEAIATIQRQLGDAQAVLADLMRGWNHGAKLMEAANRLYTEVVDARATATDLL